jgi:hypothetical protein
LKTTITKILVLGLLAMNLWALASGFGIDIQTASAQFLPINEDSYSDVFVSAEGETAVEKASTLTFKVVRVLQYIVAAIVILLGMLAAVQMVTSDGNEENFDKAKKSITFSIIGLAVIALSSEIAKILDLTGGGLLGSRAEVIKRADIFTNGVQIIITFSKYLIGAVAVLVLARSAIRMITIGANEDDLSQDKQSIGAVVVGLVALIFIDSFIQRVFFVTDSPYDSPAPDISQGLREVAGFTNLIVSFVGPIAILSLVGAAVMYAISGGNDETQEKAKKMMIASLVGIIFIYGAFGLVSTFIAGQF